MKKTPAAIPSSERQAPKLPTGRRYLAAGLLIALSSALPGAVHASSLAEQMARAMARMMQAFSDEAGDSGSSSFDLQMGPQSWGGMSPGMGSSPWGNPWTNPWSTPGNQWSIPGQMPGQMPGTLPNWGSPYGGVPNASGPIGSGTQRLDGAWLGNQGFGLIIRGRKLRLVGESEQYRDMTLAYEGDHLWLFDRDSGTAKRYEFARADDRMALRDTDGNTLLFRRWKAPKRSQGR